MPPLTGSSLDYRSCPSPVGQADKTIMSKSTFSVSALITFVFVLVPFHQAFASHEAHDTAALNDDPELWPQVPRVRPVPSRAFLRARDGTVGW